MEAAYPYVCEDCGYAALRPEPHKCKDEPSTPSVPLKRVRPDLHAAPYLDEDRRVLTVQEIHAVNAYMDELEGLLRSCEVALEAVGGELEAALSKKSRQVGA